MVRDFLRLAAITTLTACVVSCSSDDDDDHTPGETNGTLALSGKVVRLSGSYGSRTTENASGVAVRATCDVNGDGSIQASEVATAETDANGAYSLSLAIATSKNVVVHFTEAGSAPVFRTVRVANGGTAIVDAKLATMSALSCTAAGDCADENRSVRVTGLAEGFEVNGRAFNPVTDAAQFPGRFADSQGNQLLSGVFSFVQVVDESDNEVELPLPVTLRMQLPRDTWPIAVDISEGNSAIDVPLYAFDEVTGEWVRDGQGYLEDGDGAVIPESTLVDIRNGTYASAVYVRGEVSHFSYWNCDWPIASHGCLTFEVVDQAGNAITDASVTVSGTTYNGSTDATTVDTDGGLCVDVMRSETPGEDVDNDGIEGETQEVRIRVATDGKFYDLGTANVSTAAGTCGDSTCTNLGQLVVEPSKELALDICTVTGVVRDISGNLMPDLLVVGFDDSLASADTEAVCGSACTSIGFTDVNGAFSLTTAVQSGVYVQAYSSTADEAGTYVRYGIATRDLCPTQPVTVVLDQGYDMLDLDVSASWNGVATVFSWSPALPMNYVAVSSAGNDLRWGVVATEDSTFAAPITYGTVPSAAEQFYPLAGAATPLAVGDIVQVYGSSVSAGGFYTFASGELTLTAEHLGQ